VVLPPEAAGQRIVAHLEPGGESYGMLMECYAGHGIRVAHAGPVPEGRQTIPEPETGCSTYGICFLSAAVTN
jgi:hypothetical protein